MKKSILSKDYDDLLNLLDEFLKKENLSTFLTKKSDKIISARIYGWT